MSRSTRRSLLLLTVLALAKASLAQDVSGGAGAVPAQSSIATTSATTSSTPSTSASPSATTTPASTTTPSSAASTTPIPSSTSITSGSGLPLTTSRSSQPATPTSSAATFAASASSSVVVLTITSTAADGSVVTDVSSSESALPTTSPPTSSSDSGTTGKTWAIVGGVVGGLVGLAGICFIVFRCTQKRFGELDDDDVAIKWPELVNRGEDATTLNPLAARQGSGHGVGDDGDHEEKGGASLAPYSDSHGTMGGSSAYSGTGGYGEQQAYYDPYLGPTAAPQPYPPNLAPMDQGYPPHSLPYSDFATLGAPGQHPSRTPSPGLVQGGGVGAGGDLGQQGVNQRMSMVGRSDYRMSWAGDNAGVGGEAIPMGNMSQGHDGYWQQQVPQGPREEFVGAPRAGTPDVANLGKNGSGALR